MSRDSGFMFRKFLFSPDSVLKFRKSYQIWDKLAKNKKLQAKKKSGVENTLPPSAYRVEAMFCLLNTVNKTKHFS